MRENEGLYRAARLVRRTVIGIAAMIVAVVALGYFFLMRPVNRQAAWSEAARELEGSVLHYGEPAERIARVYRRRGTNYFRAANGLLVATPERLVFVGIEPRDKLAGDDAPSTIVTAELRNDTLLHLTPGRVYGMTGHGIVAQHGGKREEFAAAPGYESELDSLARYVDSRHTAERRLTAANRSLHAAVAELVQRPLKYQISRGDALSTIAARFGATPAQIRDWNDMPGDRVRIGDSLVVKPAG